MDAISNVDRLMVLLRKRLLERTRTAGPRRKDSPPEPGVLQALAAIGDVDDRQLRRAFIQSLLVDQFGPNMINDAKFQQVVSQVTASLTEDPNLGALLAKVMGELRATAATGGR